MTIERVDRVADVWRVVVMMAAVTVALLAAAVEYSNAGQFLPDASARALDGAIDIHVHSYPDVTQRSMDAIEVAALSKARGMRAIVLKNHYDATAGLAYMVRKQVTGIEVFGGIDLNLPTGGMNAAAVEHMTQMSGGWGRFVWMSTSDAENYVRSRKVDRPMVKVSKDGELLPETKAVIAVIAKHKELVLATGHASAEEGLMLLREGKRQGVQHMVVTHAHVPYIAMTVPQMQEAAKLGAFIEFAGASIADAAGQAKMDMFAATIPKVGAEFCILSADLGLKGDALPPDGFAAIILALKARGIPERDLDLMTKRNPARVLGLP